MHRGIEPVVLHVAGDGRLGRGSPRPGFTSTPINNSCTLVAIDCRDGLHATAVARTYSFGTIGESERSDFDLALQISAARQAAMTAGTTIQEVFQAGQRVAVAAGLEHSWARTPHWPLLGLVAGGTAIVADIGSQVTGRAGAMLASPHSGGPGCEHVFAD